MAEQELATVEEIDSDYSHGGADIDRAAEAWHQQLAPEDEDNQGDDLESQDSDEEGVKDTREGCQKVEEEGSPLFMTEGGGHHAFVNVHYI